MSDLEKLAEAQKNLEQIERTITPHKPKIVVDDYAKKPSYKTPFIPRPVY